MTISLKNCSFISKNAATCSWCLRACDIHGFAFCARTAPPLGAAAELAAQKFVFVKSAQMHAAANRTFHQSCFSSNFASAMVMLLLLHTTASTTGHSNRNPPNSGLAYL